MADKLYFAWELGTRGAVPVFYHGYLPNMKDPNRAGSPRLLIEPIELSPEDTKELGEGDSFPTWLREKYPAPSIEDL